MFSLRRLGAVVGVVGTSISLVVAVAPPAGGTYPGRNGAVYISAYDGNDYELYRATFGPNGMVNLTDSADHEQNPEWNREGTMMVAQCQPPGPPQVCLFEPDGDVIDQITDVTEAYAPSFKPNGQKVIFGGYDGQDSEIFIVDSEGNLVPEPITDTTRNEYTPEYQPRGNWIAYIKDVNDNSNIFRMRPDGSDAERLIKANAGSPSWSPDGRWILYNRDVGENGDLFMMRTDGTDKTRLTNTPNRHEYFPVMSPNEKLIAYVFEGNVGLRLAKMRVSTGEVIDTMAHMPGNFDQPTWRPIVEQT